MSPIPVRASRGSRIALRLVLFAAAVTVVGCSDRDAVLQQHREKSESLRSTTTAIGETWLAGNASDRYTRTAFRRTYELVEHERRGLVRAPETVAELEGARLSKTADHLTRALASLIQAVADHDAESVRRQLSAIPAIGAEQP